jgi:hypothetical protein
MEEAGTSLVSSGLKNPSLAIRGMVLLNAIKDDEQLGPTDRLKAFTDLFRDFLKANYGQPEKREKPVSFRQRLSELFSGQPFRKIAVNLRNFVPAVGV